MNKVFTIWDAVRLAISLTFLSYVLANATPAHAMGPDNAGANPNAAVTDANPYYQADHFQWNNYNDDVHLLTAFSVTVVGTMILEHKLDMPRWQASLIMGAAVGLFGVLKETMHDSYTSRTDIKTWLGGAGAAILTINVLQF